MIEKLKTKTRRLNITKVKSFGVALSFTLLAIVGLLYLLFQFVVPATINFTIATLDRWFSGQLNFTDGVFITLFIGYITINHKNLFGDNDNEK